GSEHVAVDEIVAELAVRVEPAREAGEVVDPWVPRPYGLGSDGEELSPVRTCLEGREALLDRRHHREHGGLVGDPGEVQPDGRATVTRTRPELVTGHRADLADLERRRDAVPDAREFPQC